MWVKVCGIANLRTAVAAEKAGAAAVGLVFAAQAPDHRRLTLDRAEALSAGLPPEFARVGVFVNAAPAEVAQVARRVGLTHVQLHGDEPPEYLSELPLPAIKAVRLQDETEFTTLDPYLHAWGILLEPQVADKVGGSGIALDWSLARRARDYLKSRGFSGRIILAGGLNPENVRAAVLAVQPDGVDVSSGVESARGEVIGKDIDKICAFVEYARGIRP